MSASMNCTAWCCAIATPKVLRSSAYARDSSSARRMTPAAPAAIQGRVRSKVRIAILKPSPSTPTTFSGPSFTSSNSTSVVFDARCPILFSFLPTDTPGVARSTTKQVIPLWRSVPSARANTV